jgi:hypothetical protein
MAFPWHRDCVLPSLLKGLRLAFQQTGLTSGQGFLTAGALASIASAVSPCRIDKEKE